MAEAEIAVVSTVTRDSNDNNNVGVSVSKMMPMFLCGTGSSMYSIMPCTHFNVLPPPPPQNPYSIQRMAQDGNNTITIIVPIVAAIAAVILIIALFCILFFVSLLCIPVACCTIIRLITSVYVRIFLEGAGGNA